MNTKKRILLTGLTAFLSQLSSILIALFLPKLIIISYGSDLNGVISAARQYSTYLMMIDSGIAAATCYQFIKAFKDNDVEKIKNLFSTVGKFFRNVAYVVIVITLIFSMCYAFILKTSTEIHMIVYIFVMYSLGTIIAFWGFFKYNLVLFSNGDQYKITLACVFSSLSIFILQYILIKLSFDIFFVVAVFPMGIFLRLLVIKRMTLAKHLYIQEGGCIDNSLISQKWDSITLNIADSMKTFAPIISISCFFGASYVSVYAIYESVLHLGSSILIICQHGITPVLGRFFIEKDDVAKQKFEYLYTIIFVISGIIVTCFSVLFLNFIKIYLGSKTDVSYIYPLLATFMIFNTWFLMVRTSYESLIKANGLIRELRNGAIVEICLALVFCFVLAKFLGFEYTIIGIIISSAYRTVRMALFCKKKMDFGKKIFLNLVIWGGLTAAIILLFKNWFENLSIAQFIGYSCLTLIVSTIVYVSVGLLQSSLLRKLFMQRICNLKGKIQQR